MIRILGYASDRAISKDVLAAALPTQWQDAWRARHGAARNEAHAVQSLAALLLLCRMHPCGTLAYDADGRPHFLEGDADFSITHTRGACFCALSDSAARIGLDAEHLSRGGEVNTRALAARFLTERERARVEKSAGDEAFLRIWTRKEAMVKRSGEGLRGLRAADSEAAGEVRFFETRVGEILVTLAHCGNDTVEFQMLEELI